jgi:hypothetical protein
VKKPQLSDAADSIGFRLMRILCPLRYLRSEYRATYFAGPFGERQVFKAEQGVFGVDENRNV